MRWYCINKYIPPTSTYHLVRAFNGEYERYFIAALETFENRNELLTWELSNDASCVLDLSKYKVTHFCIIEPVEIEE